MQHVKSTMMKKISNIRKKNNKYIITLGDNTQLEFYSDTLIKYNLLKPRELTEIEFKEIINYNNYYEAFNKALKFISVKQRTSKEIEIKLKDYSSEIVNNVISKLKELGYLNEQNYITSFINDQINLGTKGPIYIKKELEKLNLNPIYIEEAISSVGEIAWQNKLEKIINKKINANKKLSKNYLLLKLQNYAITLGYRKDTINKVLNKVNIKEKDSILDKEYQREFKRLSHKYNGKDLEIKIKSNLYRKGFNLNDIEKIINNTRL